MSSPKSYRDLIVWQKAMDLVTQVYCFTQGFPGNQTYGLTSQLQRAAVSVPANIAEGKARNGDKELRRFLRIARGSLAELETLLILARDLAYGTPGTADRILIACDEVSRLLSGLMKSLKVSE